MKKHISPKIRLILFIALFINVAFSQTALAQETPSAEPAASPGNTEENITEPQPVTPDLQYDIILEYFLNKTLQKDYETAYALTHDVFKKTNPPQTFEAILNATGLNSFASKKWTEFAPITGGALIKGEFTMPDQTIHLVTFELMPDPVIGSKISGIVETLTMADLVKRAPSADAVQQALTNDLSKITFFIKRNKARNLYKYLSAGAHQRTAYKDIQKAVRLFKKNKLDVALPKTAEITIAEGFPKMNEQGILLVQGSYKNAKNTVNFFVGYDYEWTWKPGFFSLTPLQPAPAPTQ